MWLLLPALSPAASSPPPQARQSNAWLPHGSASSAAHACSPVPAPPLPPAASSSTPSLSSIPPLPSSPAAIPQSPRTAPAISSARLLYPRYRLRTALPSLPPAPPSTTHLTPYGAGSAPAHAPALPSATTSHAAGLRSPHRMSCAPA